MDVSTRRRAAVDVRSRGLRGRPRVAQPVADRLAPVQAPPAGAVRLGHLLRDDPRWPIFGPFFWPVQPLRSQAGHASPAATRRAGSERRPAWPIRSAPTTAAGASSSLTVNGARLSLLIGRGHDAHRGDDRRRSSAAFAGLLRRLGRRRLMRFVDLLLTIPFLFVILVAARIPRRRRSDRRSRHLRAARLARPRPARPGACSCRCASRSSSRPPGRSGVSDIADHLPAHPAERARPDHRLDHAARRRRRS